MQRNTDNVIFSPPSTPLHATSNGWTAQFLQNPRCQQDCHLDHVHYGAAPGDGCIIKQSQIRERILSSPTDNIAVLPVGYLQGSNCSLSIFSSSHLPIRAQVESPADSTTENGVLPTVSVSPDQGLIPVPRYQDMAWNSRHAEVDYFSRSPTVYADEDGRFPVVSQVRHSHNEAHFVTHIGAHPAQLPHHIPFTHGRIPLDGRFPDTSPVNAITPYCDGVALDRTSDNSAYSSFAPPSLSASILLPDAVGYPLGHLRGDENFSEIGEPSVHHVTAGPTAIPRGSASYHESVNLRHDDTWGSDPYVSSWTASPNPVMPPLQGPYPLGYLAMGNISTSPEWAESSAWLRNQAYPPSYGQTEIVSAPVLPHILPYAPQPSSQSNSNSVGSLRTSPSIPVSPAPPSPSSSVACAHDGTLPIPVGPPLIGYRHTKFVVDSHEENSGRGRTRACYQVKMKGSLRASKPISTHCTGHSSKIQSRLWTELSALRSFRDRSVWTCCGWRNEDGGLCGALVTYDNCAEHFSTDHAIKDMGADVKVRCRWCPLDTEKSVTRKNILRHMREVHLHRPRSKNGIHECCTNVDAAPSL